MLINAVRKSGGLSFLAHPNDPATTTFNETDISSEDWSVTNYTGIELWNGLSQLKNPSQPNCMARLRIFS